MLYTVILVQPSKPRNLGAICRILANFECSQLILVSNQVDLTDLEFNKTARHAKKIIENGIFVDLLEEALNYVTYSIGTTARFSSDRNPNRIAFTPDDIPWNNVGKNPGFVFGTERSGLKTEEIKLLDFLITIPTSKTYSTLNLSHAVGIISHLVFRYSSLSNLSNRAVFQSPASFKLKKELQNAFEAYTKRFVIPERQFSTMQTFHNMLGRSNLSSNEGHTLVGALKAWKWHLQKFENEIK